MKSIVMPTTVQQSQETKANSESHQEPVEVKDVTAIPGKKAKTIFTAMDMWNRQKQSRSASAMIRRWNLN